MLLILGICLWRVSGPLDILRLMEHRASRSDAQVGNTGHGSYLRAWPVLTIA